MSRVNSSAGVQGVESALQLKVEFIEPLRRGSRWLIVAHRDLPRRGTVGNAVKNIGDTLPAIRIFQSGGSNRIQN